MTDTRIKGQWFPCRCGCRISVQAPSNYRPGHDARHVAEEFSRHIAVLDASFAAHDWFEHVPNSYKRAMTNLPTEALRMKWRKRVSRYIRQSHRYAKASYELLDQNWWMADRLREELRNGWSGVDVTIPEGLEKAFYADMLIAVGRTRSRINDRHS